MSNLYQQATFFQSATTLNTLPAEFGFEIAFAGRSNSGKSSTINRLCQQKSLARTSKTPGRTQLINFFRLPEGRYLVDLPGYGYAKVPLKVKLKWQRFIESYLTNRWTLRGLVLIMDIRRPMLEFDYAMLNWASMKPLAVHIVLNKSDKLKRGAAQNMYLKVKKQLKNIPGEMTVQTFSALKGTGTEEMRQRLDQWLFLED